MKREFHSHRGAFAAWLNYALALDAYTLSVGVGPGRSDGECGLFYRLALITQTSDVEASS